MASRVFSFFSAPGPKRHIYKLHPFPFFFRASKELGLAHLFIGLFMITCQACSTDNKSPGPAPPPSSERRSLSPDSQALSTSSSTPGSTEKLMGAADSGDSTSPTSPHEAGSTPEPDEPKTYFAALRPFVGVYSEMEWPPRDDDKGSQRRSKSKLWGYLRQGGKTEVYPEAQVKPNCRDGWYRLVAGGYVCGKGGTLDMFHPKLRLGPHLPWVDKPLPYEYGYNSQHGTPLYRHVPSKAERLEAEPWLKSSPKPKSERDANDAKGTHDMSATSGAAPSENPPPADPPQVESEIGNSPWYMRPWEKGKPQVTLDDLKGDGAVAKRMVRGFYLSLDKPFFSGGRRWWRTQSTLIAPAERIVVTKLPTDFHGVWLDKRAGSSPSNLPVDGNGTPGISSSSVSSPPALSSDSGVVPSVSPSESGISTPPAPKAPATDQALLEPDKAVAMFIMGKQGVKYIVSDDRKKVSAIGSLPHFAAASLTGDEVKIGGFNYFETGDGYWMRAGEGVVARTVSPPSDLEPGEKWIDVDLKHQLLIAYEGNIPVYSTLVSTGKISNVKEEDHRTRIGRFRIREKHLAATMDGDVAGDGPYSIEDVPWIMYFDGSIALHGAFWHKDFGHVHSHGCVNLAPIDARQLFYWAGPVLPSGWHGVTANESNQGTRVLVH